MTTQRLVRAATALVITIVGIGSSAEPAHAQKLQRDTLRRDLSVRMQDACKLPATLADAVDDLLVPRSVENARKFTQSAVQVGSYFNQVFIGKETQGQVPIPATGLWLPRGTGSTGYGLLTCGSSFELALTASADVVLADLKAAAGLRSKSKLVARY